MPLQFGHFLSQLEITGSAVLFDVVLERYDLREVLLANTATVVSLLELIVLWLQAGALVHKFVSGALLVNWRTDKDIAIKLPRKLKDLSIPRANYQFPKDLLSTRCRLSAPSRPVYSISVAHPWPAAFLEHTV